LELEKVLLGYATPFLAGIGAIVVLAFLGMKFFGLNIRSLRKETDENDGYRRKGDEILSSFLKVYGDQITLLQKTVDTQEQVAHTLKEQTQILINNIDIQKDMSRDIKEIHRKTIG